MRGGRAAEIVTLLILAFGVWLGFASAGLPAVIPASAPPAAFSAARAMHDLTTVAATPHPVGTVAHDRLRDYLVDRLRALGCDDVHIQSATGFNTLDGPIAATVANVVCRKRGARPGPGLLLTAHYDAVPRSFGAGDDGAGVAAILETLRALASAPPLINDLIIVFSDAEEDGLLGAEAFVDLHPWAKDVGAVLNFEGRGDAGPVFMFQTSPGNANLIRALATSVPDARTNSVTGEVYRHLPSDTDLSIWLHSGFSVGALNFAHVGGYQNYHTPMDNIASLDPRVLQHMGDYALGMARALGKADLHAARTHDAIYFNAPLLGVVHYSASLALPLSVLGLIAIAVLVGVAARRRAISGRGVGQGLGLVVLTLVVPPLATLVGWRIIVTLHPGYAEILQGDPYNSLWYLLVCGAFTVAVAVELQRRFSLRATSLELAVAPLVLWSLLGFTVSSMLPGASYLFIWPLLAAVLGSVLLLRPGSPAEWPSAVLAIPALVLWPPLIKSFEVALTANMLPFCTLLAALVLSLLVVPMRALGELRRWVAVGALLVGIGALVGAETTSGFTAIRKHPDSLVYLLEADSSRAWWVSFDRTADSWTAHALGPRPARRTFDQYFAGPVLAAPAPSGEMPASPVGILETQLVAGGRRIHLHVARSGDAEKLLLRVNPGTVVKDVVLNGRELADGGDDRYRPGYRTGRDGIVLCYFGVPEDGVDLWMTIQSAAPIPVRFAVTVEGLPANLEGQFPPRPARLMSKPFLPTDVTIVERVIQM
jgi:hypothetical protein